jgi:hypothetical protein
VDLTTDTAPNRCGLGLTGIQGWKFGYMYGATLRGDVVRIMQNFVTTIDNTDPYHVAFCHFQGIDGTGCQGWSLNNDNLAGFNFNNVYFVRNINGLKGLVRSSAEGNVYHMLSCAGCQGYAIDLYFTGGTFNREKFIFSELDGPEKAIHVGTIDSLDLGVFRINTRPQNGAGIWPTTGIFLEGVGGRIVRNIKGNVIVRTNAATGGFLNGSGVPHTTADYGFLFDFASSPNLLNNNFTFELVDGAQPTIGTYPSSKYYTNLHVSARVRVASTVLGVLVDQLRTEAALISAPTTPTEVVATGGFPTSATALILTVVRKDDTFSYSTTTGLFTAPRSGWVRGVVNVIMTGLPVNTRVRCGWVVTHSGTPATWSASTDYCNNATDWTLKHEGLMQVTAGDTFFFACETARGATTALEAGTDGKASNFMIVEYVGGRPAVT